VFSRAVDVKHPVSPDSLYARGYDPCKPTAGCRGMVWGLPEIQFRDEVPTRRALIGRFLIDCMATDRTGVTFGAGHGSPFRIW